MIVVADTSPLNYLALTGNLPLLPALFGRVFVPPAVARELLHPAAPSPSRELIEHSPEWLSIQAPQPVSMETVRSAGVRLGAGELEAIALAKDLHADLLLLDERLATKEARARHNLRVTGLLGIFRLASARNLIDLPTAIEQLRQTSYYLHEQLVAHLLEEDALLQRKRTGAQETPDDKQVD